MNPDDHVCLCFRVSLRKIRTFLAVENPPVASLISECLSAGTGCRWCVPFLNHLHAQHRRGQTPDLGVSPQRYAEARLGYHQSGERDEGVLESSGLDAEEVRTGRRNPPDEPGTARAANKPPPGSDGRPAGGA